VGKCIVCQKSAGPFYSLHKACYQVYEDTRECLRQVLSSAIDTSIQVEGLTESLNDCRPTLSFSLRLFESLVRRAWHDQAKQIVKRKVVNAEHANYILSVASALEVEDKDVDSNLFVRLANIEHLACINQNQPISKRFTEMENRIKLSDDETLIWVFEEALKLERHKRTEEKQWSVFQSLVYNLFKKSRYKKLSATVEATGDLAISNKNLYYVTKNETSIINFLAIHSITPMKDGVRIQSAQGDAVPDTYITGDGRFTYALLRYAQEQKFAE
jgi:hypothetical protein